MTIGKNLHDGSGTIHLSADEMKRFEAGKPVGKKSGDSFGMFYVHVKLTRPRSKAKRFPASMGY